jgi:HAD superfamily hydrolase (TIGR01490 family)
VPGNATLRPRVDQKRRVVYFSGAAFHIKALLVLERPMFIEKVDGAGQGAFFDLEKTITADAAEQAGALHFYRLGEIPLTALLRVAVIYLQYNLGLISNFEELKRSGAILFRGRAAARDQAIFDQCFEARLRHSIYADAISLIRQFQEADIPVYIISSTYRFIVEPYARHLGIEHYYGTQLEVVDGLYTGNIVAEIYHQHNKARLVREIAEKEGIDLSRSYAFGDSENDRLMLEAVGRPAAVNPDRKLRAVASRRGWPIMSWRLRRAR